MMFSKPVPFITSKLSIVLIFLLIIFILNIITNYSSFSQTIASFPLKFSEKVKNINFKNHLKVKAII